MNLNNIFIKIRFINYKDKRFSKKNKINQINYKTSIFIQ